MRSETFSPLELKFLVDRWDSSVAANLDGLELLRYRSNLLGSDLRVTNFAGGNTSSKIVDRDPLTGHATTVLWVKGSGGDLGTIQKSGFACLYQDKLLALERLYRGESWEDEMADMYPLCAFRTNSVAASIDTPLHGFLPFPHVDHLHPDWGIALAASANGKAKMEEFNREFKHNLIWIPWQRPGFELAMMMKRAVEENPGCDGIVLGGHGLFTWGNTQRDCYVNTITTIDQIGQFIEKHRADLASEPFGGAVLQARPDRRDIAQAILPFLRGRLSTHRRVIGSFTDSGDVLGFVNSRDAKDLAFLGTSCPDHFIRTKIRPMFVAWPECGALEDLKTAIEEGLAHYRQQYEAYYQQHATPESPSLRDPNPTVVLVSGLGMFSFGKNKTESRITGEFYKNAIHVMDGASLLAGKDPAPNTEVVPQCGEGMDGTAFRVFTNYVALPLSEAFRIEYWALEEAKIQRQPPEKELSRIVVLVIGGGSGIGRAVALLAARNGAHVMIADRDAQSAARTADDLAAITSPEWVRTSVVDIRSRTSIQQALRTTIESFGGVDILIDTAVMFPSSPTTPDVNVTATYLHCDEVAKLFSEQDLGCSIVLAGSANAVVDDLGSEADEVSKTALSQLVRELSVRLGPKTRVNGISPATVVKGFTIFPRHRVRASLTKYRIPFDESMSDDELRKLLAEFYAQRTPTHEPIDPVDCAEAILFLAGPRSRCISGHLIPIGRELVEGFLQ